MDTLSALDLTGTAEVECGKSGRFQRLPDLIRIYRIRYIQPPENLNPASRTLLLNRADPPNSTWSGTRIGFPRLHSQLSIPQRDSNLPDPVHSTT